MAKFAPQIRLIWLLGCCRLHAYQGVCVILRIRHDMPVRLIRFHVHRGKFSPTHLCCVGLSAKIIAWRRVKDDLLFCTNMTAMLALTAVVKGRVMELITDCTSLAGPLMQSILDKSQQML